MKLNSRSSALSGWRVIFAEGLRDGCFVEEYSLPITMLTLLAGILEDSSNAEPRSKRTDRL